jgi:hypothetical protein
MVENVEELSSEFQLVCPQANIKNARQVKGIVKVMMTAFLNG